MFSQYLDIRDELFLLKLLMMLSSLILILKKLHHLKGKEYTFLYDVNKSNFEEKFNKIFKKAKYNLMKQYDEDNYYH